MNIFLDFDGTLVDVAPRHYAVYTECILELYGQPLPADEYWQLKRDKEPWEVVLPKSGVKIGYKQAFLNNFIFRIESPDFLKDDLLIPGAADFLGLASAKHDLYLVSLRRKPENLKNQIASLGIEHFFKQILSGHSENDGSDVKAAIIGQIAQTDDVIIGDTEADILTAKQLGLKGVAVTSGIRSKQFLAQMEPYLLLESIASPELRAFIIDVHNK